MPVALSIRAVAASGVALTACLAVAPASAQQIDYEQRTYEYAQSAPQDEARPVFVRQPVVQPVPETAESSEADAGTDYEYEYEMSEVAPAPVVMPPMAPVAPAWHYPAGPMHPPMGHPAMPASVAQQPYAAYPGYAGYPAYPGYSPQAGYPPMPPVFDRDAWIADCRAYLREERRRADRGGTAGGLLGAVAGGVIGNRITDGERLGGTLIGAGIGGLAGLFIGQAIAMAGGDGTKRDCKDWLRSYESAHARGGWGWSGGYMVMPQTTVIVQHTPMVPVVREIVREEWVTDKVVTHKKVHQPALAPAPKVRSFKAQPAKPVKYSKQR